MVAGKDELSYLEGLSVESGVLADAADAFIAGCLPYPHCLSEYARECTIWYKFVRIRQKRRDYVETRIEVIVRKWLERVTGGSCQASTQL